MIETMVEFITTSLFKTRALGVMLAKELKGDPVPARRGFLPTGDGSMRGGMVICLVGELGAGKTSFAQGLLKGLGAKGPYTSPTFVVMKEYKIKNHLACRQAGKSKVKNAVQNSKISNQIKKIYHLDAYRVMNKDVLSLGWEEIVDDKNSVIIVEWAERIRKIVPKDSLWVKFEWVGEKERKIIFDSKQQTINNKSLKNSKTPDTRTNKSQS